MPGSPAAVRTSRDSWNSDAVARAMHLTTCVLVSVVQMSGTDPPPAPGTTPTHTTLCSYRYVVMFVDCVFFAWFGTSHGLVSVLFVEVACAWTFSEDSNVAALIANMLCCVPGVVRCCACLFFSAV